MANLKILTRMTIFAIVGYVLSSTLTGIVVLAMVSFLPADSSSRLLLALRAEWFVSLTNVVLWPLCAVIIYGLERWWQSWRPNSKLLSSGCVVRGLGAFSGAILVAAWAQSAYTLCLLLIFPSSTLVNSSSALNNFGQMIGLRGWAAILAWIIALVTLWQRATRNKATTSQQVNAV
jgi:hypothetical protein